MTIPRWLKHVLPVVAIVVAGGIYVFTEHFPAESAPPKTPSVPPVVLTAEDPGGRGSENFRIVDDSTDADIGSELSPSDAAEALDDGTTLTAVIETNASVTHVADGDTFDVTLDNGENATIRMLGVDTPETVDPRKPVQCFGKEASNLTKSKLTDARIYLAADPQADERDKYGRLLRNVTLEDGTDYNLYLVQQGYAHAYLSFPLDAARKKQLADAEKEAKEQKRGLWAPDACK
jgi:micrococcal nuclease